MKVPDVEHISYREEFHTDVLQFLRVNRKLLGFGKHFAFYITDTPRLPPSASQSSSCVNSNNMRITWTRACISLIGSILLLADERFMCATLLISGQRDRKNHISSVLFAPVRWLNKLLDLSHIVCSPHLNNRSKQLIKQLTSDSHIFSLNLYSTSLSIALVLQVVLGTMFLIK